MESIKERGYVIISKEKILIWEKCPNCSEITHGVFPFKALNVYPTCIYCGHFIMGVPLPSTEDRIKLLGYDPWRACGSEYIDSSLSEEKEA